jgi:transposase
MDVHKDSISIAVLRGDDSVDVERIFHDEESVRRFMGRFDQPGRLRACYEAGPTGYELHRLLCRLGVACDVVAPSLIPRAPGDRVKTDQRDCRKLARLHRMNELVAIRVPTPAEEAVRDLCRARAVMVEDLRRSRQRLVALLLRHSRIFRDGTHWTVAHERWLLGQRFDEPALQHAYDHYRATVDARDAHLEVLDRDLRVFVAEAPFAATVSRLIAYRGVDELGALAIAAEVCDFRRFAKARQFMGFTGLTPIEYSSGSSQWRGHIAKTGPTHLRHQLVESAWAYRHRPAVGATIRRRQQQAPPDTVARAWKAQLRLTRRFRALAARKDSQLQVATAIARELAGFLWAEMIAV